MFQVTEFIEHTAELRRVIEHKRAVRAAKATPRPARGTMRHKLQRRHPPKRTSTRVA